MYSYLFSDRDVEVAEHYRDANRLLKRCVSLQSKLPNGAAIMSTTDIPGLGVKQRTTILINAALEYSIDDENISGSQEDLEHVLVAVISMWMQHSNIMKNGSCTYKYCLAAALLVSFVHLLLVDNKSMERQNLFIPQWKSTITGTTFDWRWDIHRKIRAMFVARVFHGCSEFESCILVLHSFNGVLNCPGNYYNFISLFKKNPY